MAIKDGEVVEADELLNNLVGDQFKNWMNLIWNSDYIGWNAKLNYDKEGASGGTPGTSNLLWDNFTTTGAAQRDKIGVESSYGLEYDSTNDVYYAPDIDVTEYVIIEATSLSAPWDSNNCKTLQIASGKWLVYCDTGTAAVHRAQIHKSLWYGTTGSDSLILDFTTVTSVQTSHANDVGKRAFYASASLVSSNSTYTGTFADTSTNTDCSSWSDLRITGGVTSTEMGTDTSADEANNPTDCQLEYYFSGSYYMRWEIPEGTTKHSIGPSGSYDAPVMKSIVLSKGDCTWVFSGSGSGSVIDFNGDHSIPDMIAAGTLSAEGADTGTLISNDVATAVTNGIPVWNATIDSGSTQVVYLSADDGSNWEAATEKEIKRLSNAGSNFKFKWEVVRTDLSKEDTISAFGVLYSLGAGSG